MGKGWNCATPRAAAKKKATKKVAQAHQRFHIIIPKPTPPKRKREGATPAMRLTFDPDAQSLRVKAWWVRRDSEEAENEGFFDF